MKLQAGRLLIGGGFLIIASAYGLAYWQWLARFEAAVPEGPVPGPERSVARPAPDLGGVALLFGEATPPKAVTVRESRLPLKLVASLVADERGRSAAILGRGGKQRLYFQGSEVMPGVRLVQVHARRVLIERQGALESLSLPRPADVAVLGARGRVRQ